MDNKIQIILNQENKSNTDNKNITIIVSKLEKIKLLEKKAITLDEKIETIKIQVNKETQLAIKKIQKAE